VADLKFSQSERRNFTAPILIALVVLGIATALVLHFTPHTTADVTVKKSAVYASHLVFQSGSIVVGRDHSQDDMYALVTLHIDNRLRLPLFLKDFTATINPSNPDGSPAESIDTSAAEKPDIPNLYVSFPAIKALADQQASPLLLRDTQIDPGHSAEGMLLLRFPVDQATWDKRKSATVTIAFYHQQPLTIEIPKTNP
jgi:hypothetical protein